MDVYHFFIWYFSLVNLWLFNKRYPSYICKFNHFYVESHHFDHEIEV